jgi:hypothetical protein
VSTKKHHGKLTPWRKGQSGNPRGLWLPPDLSLDELIKSDKYTDPRKLHRMLMKQARSNPAALQCILARKLGPPPSAPVQPDPAVALAKSTAADLKRLSEEELLTLMRLQAKIEGVTLDAEFEAMHAQRPAKGRRKQKRGVTSDEDPKASQPEETKDQYDQGYNSYGKPN